MPNFECIKTCTWQNKLCEIGKVYSFSDKEKPFAYVKETSGNKVKNTKLVIGPHPYLIEIKEEKPKPKPEPKEEPEPKPEKKPDVKKDE